MRNSTKNVIVAVVALILAAAIVIACGVGSSWFTNSDIATWFNSWGKGEQTEQPDEETPEEEGGMQIGEAEGSGISLMSAEIAAADYEEYGVSAQAENAFTLTATLTPADSYDKTVDWSVRWQNSNSSWAKGKTVTDYVTVTPTSDGALTASVACLQDFGEKIEVVCTSRANENASATCVCDYAKRVESFSIVCDDSSGSANASMTFDRFTTSYTCKEGDFETHVSDIYLIYTDYTVDDNFTTSVSLSGNLELAGYINSAGGSCSIRNIALNEGDYIGLNQQAFKNVSGGYNYGLFADLSIPRQVVSEHSDLPVLTITAKATGTHSTFTQNFNIFVTASSIRLTAQNVDLSDSTHLF